MAPRIGEDQLVDVVVCPQEVDVLLIVEGGLVAVDRASRCGGGRRVRQLGEVVVSPCIGEEQLVDVVVGSQIVDVLLLIEGGFVAIHRAAWSGGGCPGQLSQVVMVPRIVEEEFVDVVAVPR